MPIAFARLEFVKRSDGKNACGKAAYNSRSRISFQGNEWVPARTYDWSFQEPPIYHDILLPEGVDPKFKSPELLWNLVEKKDVRRNSQTALELVLALPDDKVISLEDKITLACTFTAIHFVNKGLIAQIDIHPPAKKMLSNQKGETESLDHNWHAHVLIATRRFKENGLELADHKARDIMPEVREGKVIMGAHWGKLWAQHQNAYFEQKGLSLRVDAEGIVPQKHLGPVRMRSRALSLLHEHELRQSLNSLESEDPKNILEKITQTKNIFTEADVDRFLHKHVDPLKVFDIKEAFWKQTGITQLLDPKSQKPLNKFTTPQIIAEEKQILRLGDKLFAKDAFRMNPKKIGKFTEQLTQEQKKAFQLVMNGQKLTCIEGFAGTGKSYLLAALKQAYESEGYAVRGLGPDTATAKVLKEKGFSEADNMHQFLFSLHHTKRQIKKLHEVWIVDEVGKLGTRPLLEFLKYANKYGAQVILSGDPSQLPPVERGLGFKSFTQRYGACQLVDIQRQNDAEQRVIAKKLAVGEMGHALDAISRLGAIKWSSSKEDAITNLITSWAINKAKNPHASSIIIANSNQEVKVLNELVRLYRKEAGELPDQEFQCETAFGKIYVSRGDRIEFRQNDKELKVSNGMQGVLIKAGEDSFTVQVQDKEKPRSITFDPRYYRSFQLGYATTTFYRSQGRTADRAFVLHSSVMNKEMFYVGLTRHAKQVEFFISEREAKNLSDLKRQAFIHSSRVSTLEYSNSQELFDQNKIAKKHQKIEDLKASNDTIDRLKGVGLAAWEEICNKTLKVIEQYQDIQPQKAFFNPKIEKNVSPSKVQEVSLTEDKLIDFNMTHTLSNQSTAPITKPVKQAAKESKAWESLSEDKKSQLNTYFRSIDRASSLYLIVKAEEESGEKSPHYQEWQKACGERNRLAYDTLKHMNTCELRTILGTKGTEILQDRASKHEAFEHKNDNPLNNLDFRLKENLETLLYHIFPEGPTRRDSKGLRFGSKGSLAVTCSGSKKGTFFDFERQEGGGPLQLIQYCKNCIQSEAITWAKDFLGQSPNPIPSHFTFKKPEKNQEWQSLKPDIAHKEPWLSELSKGLTMHYKETARYAYRNLNGDILFYTLRLEDEKGKKIVLPLSYGYFQGNQNAPSWSLKGYQVDQKPLYNLHLPQEYPTAKILIIEGEKTADAASKMFSKEKMICISWPGGAGAVHKCDWSPLFMRDVVIWPDNDKAGFDASTAICNILRRTGIKSLSEVNREMLQKELPAKWDLADPLPIGKGDSFITDSILRTTEKGIGLPHLLAHLKSHKLEINQNIALQALATIEERLRPSLEEKYGHKNADIRNSLLEATLSMLKDPAQLKQVCSAKSNTYTHLHYQELREDYAIRNDKSLER